MWDLYLVKFIEIVAKSFFLCNSYKKKHSVERGMYATITTLLQHCWNALNCMREFSL